MSRDHAAVALDRGAQLEPFGIVHARGASRSRSSSVDRQLVHLLIGAHLQPVFQPSQKHIGRIELVPRPSAGSSLAPPAAAARWRSERALQPPILAAADQLKGLHDELDLADAAVAELDVVGELAALHLALDQRLHLAQRLEHAEIEVAAIHEWLDRAAKQFRVARLVGDRRAP